MRNLNHKGRVLYVGFTWSKRLVQLNLVCVTTCTLAEEEYIARSREVHYPPDSSFVDEYDDANDMGFWRVEIEDQAAFICNELDLTDEQALYLLHALGLLPEGASLDDFRLPGRHSGAHAPKCPLGAIHALLGDFSASIWWGCAASASAT